MEGTVIAATVRIGVYTGASESAVTNVDDEGGGSGVVFNREDTVSGTDNPIPIPSTTGTNFSWHKNFALNVTTGDDTSISNRRVRHESALPTGMVLSFVAGTAYVQSAAADDDDESNNSATPAGYTDMTTSNQVWAAGTASASSTGRNGDFCRVALAVDSTYTLGASSGAAVGSLKFVYDEA